MYAVIQTGESRPLNSLVSEEIFRIAGEAITNAFKHANASKIEVNIQYDRRAMQLAIRDDGRGIPLEVIEKGYVQNHFCLPGKHERAEKIGAQLHVRSRAETGTEISIQISHGWPTGLYVVEPSPLARRSVWHSHKGIGKG